MINNKWVIAIFVIILGLYVQPVLAQEAAKNLTVTVNAFTGEEGNEELKGNLIITENEGKDKKINISFTNLIEENSSQVLSKNGINVTYDDRIKDQSKYIVIVKGYGVWVGEISINTTGIKSGTYSGKAIIEGANFTPLDVDISLKLAKPTWPKWLVLLVVAVLIIIAVSFLFWVKDPKFGPILALIPVLSGILLLDAYSPFDALGNILLKTAFLVPLAAYIVDVLKTRRDNRLTLEKSVTDVKKQAIEDAVDFHSKLIEELNTHAATFTCIDGLGANPLEDKVWNDGKKKSGMVSDYPGYRLARYYQYTDDFNKYLKALTSKYLFSWDNIPGSDSEKLIEFLKQNFGIDGAKTAKIERMDKSNIKVSIEQKHILLKLNDKKNEIHIEINDGRTDKLAVKNRIIYEKNYFDFCGKFNDLNEAYKELEDILYINLFYNIGYFQNKFRSFKEIEVPFRIPSGLSEYLKNVGVAEENINKDKIYNEKVATKLNKKLESEFEIKYENLREKLQKLSEFDIQKESSAKTSNPKKISITLIFNEETNPPSISITSPDK